MDPVGATAKRAVLPVRRQAVALLAPLAGASVLFVALMQWQGGSEIASPSLATATADKVKTGGIITSNTYTAEHGQPGRGYPWLREGTLVEPHRETWLELSKVADYDCDSVFGCSAAWQIDQLTSVESASSSSSSSAFPHALAAGDGTGQSVTRLANATAGWRVSLVFHALGSYRASVTIAEADGRVAEAREVMLTCRYVRRSIRALDAGERGRWFDAFRTMLDVPLVEGLAKYGASYRDLDHFNRLHLNRAAGRRNDAMHDGMGFLTQHASVTDEFERALQAIDPSLSVPYWDYTQDAAMVRAAHGAAADASSLWELDVWGDEWFGSAGGAAHTVEAGRFAFQTVTRDANATVRNPYGYLRSPWNVNKSPYLTRVHKFCERSYPLDFWPSCATHHNLTFDDAYDSWYTYVWQASYAPHGPVHFMIGGYTNCGEVEARLGALSIPESALAKLQLNMINVPKNMWRSHFVEMPDFCSDDTPQNACHLICTGNATDATFGAEVFADGGTFGQWVLDLEPAKYAAVLEVLCTTPWSPGEQMESASPADVSFWPIHPTMDRLLQYKRLAKPFVNGSWAKVGADPDPFSPFATEYCEYHKYGCSGHHAYDLTVSATRVYDEASGAFVERWLTNGELFHMMNPNSYYMHYVYDTFEWEHCDGTSYAFPPLAWAESN